MPETLNFYMDDSGIRHPTRKVGKRPKHGYDWFALGGVLIHSRDEAEARAKHEAFYDRWELSVPLHSSEIRSQNENFSFLRGWENSKQDAFYEELYLLMRDMPMIGIACTIDRPGYKVRYLERYRGGPWNLCKTAFTVAVERAVKYSISQGLRLRVYPEKCNKDEDNALAEYYGELKAQGMPFSKEGSGKYAPLAPEQFANTLYEFKLKSKTSPMSQLADLYLWAIAIGGYHASNRTFKRLKEDGKLIECVLPEADWETLGSKYSCFEGVERVA